MKAYMSYWKGGYRGVPTERLINLHKLSVHFAKQHFNEVHLITDSESKEYFKNVGFSTISTELDNLDLNYGQVWCLGKLLAYRIIAQKGDPFIHIDYDVFLFKPPTAIINADVFGQSPENVIYFFYEVDKFVKNCPLLYKAKQKNPINGVNMGIFGGRDLEFIETYATDSIAMVMDPLNKNFWLEYNGFSNHWVKAVLAEQYYLSVMADTFNKKITCLFPGGYPTEEQTKQAGYTHLMAAKNREDILSKINFLIRKYKL
jgi:hypothetical protein